MSADTPGGRLYLIRLACGDGVRRAETMVEFARRVEAQTGERYHPTTISMLERNQQGWRLTDVRAFAAVDPLKRGAAWLSALDEERPAEIESSPSGAAPYYGEPAGTFASVREQPPVKKAAGSKKRL